MMVQQPGLFTATADVKDLKRLVIAKVHITTPKRFTETI